MITIKNAQSYSTNGELAYQIDYSDGTSVRTVESSEKIIRTEYKLSDAWVANKPLKVAHSRKRQAERIKAAVLGWLRP